MKRVIKWLGLSLVVVALLAGGIAAWLYWPQSLMPLDEMVPADAGFDPMAYGASMPSDAGDPAILVLGTTHLSGSDRNFRAADLDQVAEALADFRPDLVVVEYLGPDYPVGFGRDYRTEFDFEQLSEDWAISKQVAEVLIASHRGGNRHIEPCRLAQAYFLYRDYMNGLYYWDDHECPSLARHAELREWRDDMLEHEAARFAFPAARANGLDEVVSFDYQGDDAEWFIHGMLQEAIEEHDWLTVWELRPLIPRVGETRRAAQAHYGGFGDDIIAYLHRVNSPRHLAHQYWVYEVEIPEIRVDNAGARQTENYWLRNRRMFEILDRAAKDADAERVLVVVGSGHKYFLDELAREAGYRWIDPREWLPEPARNH